MRAAVFTAAREVRIVEVPRPEPAAGEVRVRLEGCGICGSNLPVWEGRPWFEYPLQPGAPGHEGWGVIDALGPEVRELHVGERVALLSYQAFAEFDLAPASSVVRLPAELDGQPFPAEPLACALNIFERSDIGPGQTVAILGIGFQGALLTQLAQRAGARVLAFSRRPSALRTALELGAAAAFALDDPQTALARVLDLTQNAGCERVIEATGQAGPLELAGELCRIRGKLIIAGYHQDGPRQINLQLWNWRGLDVINAHEREPAAYVRGMRGAISAVARGDIDPAPFYTHRFPLEELPAAFEAARQRPEEFLKALVLMT
jgi:threonine dehydrogenase-like Zn-dependent dehydrogenase